MKICFRLTAASALKDCDTFNEPDDLIFLIKFKDNQMFEQLSESRGQWSIAGGSKRSIFTARRR